MKKISKGIKISLFCMFIPILLLLILIPAKEVSKGYLLFCLVCLFLGIITLVKLHLNVRDIAREVRRDIENTLQNLFKGAL